MNYLAVIFAILACAAARPQWKNHGMQEEIGVIDFPDENESPIYLNKRMNQQKPLVLTNPVERDSSEEMDKDNTQVNSEPKNVGVELIFGPDSRYASNPFEIQDPEWDLSKYASMKDEPSNENDVESNEKQYEDTYRQFYLPKGLILENPQGEILEQKVEQVVVDDSNSEESGENNRQQETPKKFYNPPGVVIKEVVYESRPIEEIVEVDEQILEMPNVFPEPQAFPETENRNDEQSNEDNDVYIPQGLVVDPFQVVDTNSFYNDPEPAEDIKYYVEIEDTPRDSDETLNVEQSEVETPEVETLEVEVPESVFVDEFGNLAD